MHEALAGYCLSESALRLLEGNTGGEKTSPFRSFSLSRTEVGFTQFLLGKFAGDDEFGHA